VTAIDISAELINRAKAFAAQEGRGEEVEWLVDDAQSLNLTTAFFDLVVAHTLVSHVPQPKRVLQEAARVVRPGGTVILFDGDYATLTFGPDREMDERIITALITNPRVMRTMPHLLRDVGLELADSRSWVVTEIGRADFFLAALQSFSVLLRRQV
jgi:ubiquinone/menaquinone biosynthesis C-methylase UbiE